MTEDLQPEKSRTCAYSLYPEDIAVVEALAAEQFRYNTSEAARHIIRFYREVKSTEAAERAAGNGCQEATA